MQVSDTFVEIMVALAAGATCFVLAMAISNHIVRKRRKKGKGNGRFGKAIARVFSQSIFGVLGVGLTWTVYYMVIGLIDPARSEYAANASTLIVSVLTVFSIMIAFYEFLGRGRGDKKDDGAGGSDTSTPEAPPEDEK